MLWARHDNGLLFSSSWWLRADVVKLSNNIFCGFNIWQINWLLVIKRTWHHVGWTYKYRVHLRKMVGLWSWGYTRATRELFQPGEIVSDVASQYQTVVMTYDCIYWYKELSRNSATFNHIARDQESRGIGPTGFARRIFYGTTISIPTAT